MNKQTKKFTLATISILTLLGSSFFITNHAFTSEHALTDSVSSESVNNSTTTIHPPENFQSLYNMEAIKLLREMLL